MEPPVARLKHRNPGADLNDLAEGLVSEDQVFGPGGGEP